MQFMTTGSSLESSHKDQRVLWLCFRMLRRLHHVLHRLIVPAPFLISPRYELVFPDAREAKEQIGWKTPRRGLINWCLSLAVLSMFDIKVKPHDIYIPSS